MNTILSVSTLMRAAVVNACVKPQGLHGLIRAIGPVCDPPLNLPPLFSAPFQNGGRARGRLKSRTHAHKNTLLEAFRPGVSARYGLRRRWFVDDQIWSH